jgi:hypothetical protein
MCDLRKCRYCDTEEKTINLEENRYVKNNNEYYHYDCYIQKLINKKDPYTLKEAEIETARLWNETQKSEVQVKIKNNYDKNKLINYLIKLYGFQSSKEIPNHFFIQISNINNGKHSKISEPISCADLYYIYRKLTSYLNKLAYNKKIPNERRIFWDLSIILSKYPEYKKWKLSKLEEDEEIKRIIELHKTSNNKINSKENNIIKNEKNFNINDDNLIF